MFFKKSRHRKKKHRGLGKSKESKRFGLSKTEMEGLVEQMFMKTKIPIYRISEAR